MNEPERRFLATEAPIATGRKISGYAARFNSRSENLGTPERAFHEIILEGAFDDVLADDVIACFNHDESLILARSKAGKGSLKLTVDSLGLKYAYEAPNTTTGNDLLESIKRGDINASSFAFTVAAGDDSFTPEAGGTLRTIRKISRLYDVSAVSRPAYASATVAARAIAAEPTPAPTPRLNGWKRQFELIS